MQWHFDAQAGETSSIIDEGGNAAFNAVILLLDSESLFSNIIMFSMIVLQIYDEYPLLLPLFCVPMPLFLFISNLYFRVCTLILINDLENEKKFGMVI